MLSSIYPSALLNLKYNCIRLLFSLLIQDDSEGKSRREWDASVEPTPRSDRTSYISHKGHEFILTLYHFPSSCEVCTRPLWDVFKPPPALECRQCNAKFHKDHLDKKEKVIMPCKGQHAHSRVHRELHLHPKFTPGF
uniref:Phorbol-ester/DAG-type domain-containing protein n=1 Tax=Amphilophus citrinellus TaxID=61819 RepID=A0A3Q0RR46_AMPCI